MDDPIIMMLIGLCSVLLISGIAAMCTGGNFLWGLFLGPAGVVAAAVIAQGKKTREHIEAACNAIAAAQGARSTGRTVQAKPVCPQCRTQFDETPPPGVYECPKCKHKIVVR